MDEEIKKEQADQQPKSQQPEQQAVPPEAQAVQLSSNEKNMAMLCHLLGLLGFVGPLIVWLIEKDKSEFINQQGKAALNWQISLIIYFMASWVFIIIVIGAFLMPVLVILNIIFVVLASVKAGNGEGYVYPLAIKFLK